MILDIAVAAHRNRRQPQPQCFEWEKKGASCVIQRPKKQCIFGILHPSDAVNSKQSDLIWGHMVPMKDQHLLDTVNRTNSGHVGCHCFRWENKAWFGRILLLVGSMTRSGSKSGIRISGSYPKGMAKSLVVKNRTQTCLHSNTIEFTNYWHLQARSSSFEAMAESLGTMNYYQNAISLVSIQTGSSSW